MKTSTHANFELNNAFNHRNKDGAILGIMVIVMVGVIILTLALFTLARHSGREAIYAEKRAQAFWLAEAGIQDGMADLTENGRENWEDIRGIKFGPGSYEVIAGDSKKTNFIASGYVEFGGQTLDRSIEIVPNSWISQLQDVIHAANNSGQEWQFELSGERVDVNGDGVINFLDTGPPLPTGRGRYPGGADHVIGNIDVNGNYRMYGQSQVSAYPDDAENIPGDVSYSGDILTDPETTIAGSTAKTSIGDYTPPNLADMNYASNHTWNVAAEFARLGITSGALPSEHALHDIVSINVHPDGKDPTPNGDDDFYFQPDSGFKLGTPSTGKTPLNLKDDQTYYVEGHVWFHSKQTYGYEIDGQSVIVSTKDIHISDNLSYQNGGEKAVGDNAPDMLVLVALGDMDVNGRPTNYGDIYFGDPEYGTLYNCDAFMFANSDFLYNTFSTGRQSGNQEEPESGFRVLGNFMAMDQVVLRRDWYTAAEYPSGAGDLWAYVDAGGKWFDLETGVRLTNDQENGLKNKQRRAAIYVDDQWIDLENNPDPDSYSGKGIPSENIRHYAMQIAYDGRLSEMADNMSGMPSTQFGAGIDGIKTWREIPAP